MPRNAASLFLCLSLLAHAAGADTTPQSETEKLSYTIGVQTARGLLQQGLPLERDSFIQGVDDILSGRETQLDDEQMRRVLNDYRRSLEDQRRRSAADNREQGREFLAANANKPGVERHDSGLQYQVLRQGNGAKPAAGDTVTVHYEGRLIDGTVFDSSYQRGEPVTLQLDRVIKGWQIALPMMPEGAKWRLFIPAELGYGDQAAGAHIRPGSTLIFDVELLAIN
jgi:FKBP-type peptidyl-prolyl cis-trans isomerase FklB